MNILTIDKNEFQKGITFDNEDESGGISPNSYGLNYFLGKGFTLIPQPTLISTSLDPTDMIVSSCVDVTGGRDIFYISKDGKFYYLDNTTLTLKQTDSVREYKIGTTNIITFKGKVFCTSTSDIAYLSGTLSSIDPNWWTGTQGKTALNTSFRHPMEVIEDTLYIADNNMIHTWDGTTSVYNAMSLPTSYNITELKISNDGRTLIAFANEVDDDFHTKKATAKAFIIDTVTLEFVREITLADQVESATNVRGTTYVVYGKYFGYLTDNGIKMIRVLRGTSLIYRMKITVVDDFIVIADGPRILVYGNVSGKGNIFFYAMIENLTSIRNIQATGTATFNDNRLVINYIDGESKSKIMILDMDNRGTTTIDVFTKKYRKGKVWIRRVEIETETLASGDSLAISIVNADGTYNQIGTFSYALNGAVQTGRFECNQLVDFVQLRLQWANFAIKSIKIYYESGE